MQAGPRPLGYVLAVVLREGGEHLEDEHAGWRGGVYGLQAGAQGHAVFLEPVVGVHDHEQPPPEPVELVDEHRVELALPGVLEESPAPGPLVQRDGPGYAVVLVYTRHF